jgi:hypothetical protein
MVIAWDHFHRADLAWDAGVRWEDFLRDGTGKACIKTDTGTAWVAGREPDQGRTQAQARRILKGFGVGQGGKAMAAPGLNRCGEPCGCGAGRSRHVEGLAVDLNRLDQLERALAARSAGPLDAYMKKFGLHRPLKDLPADKRELWHVEATKD